MVFSASCFSDCNLSSMNPSVLCSSRGMCCMLSYLHNVSCTINTQGCKHRRQFCKVLTTFWRLLVQNTSWPVASGQAQFIPVCGAQPTQFNCSHLLLASNSLSWTGGASSSRLFACPFSNLQTYRHLNTHMAVLSTTSTSCNALYHLSERNFSRVNLAEGSKRCVGVGQM